MKNLMPLDTWNPKGSSIMSTNKDAIMVNTESQQPSNDIKGSVLESDMFSLYSLSPVASLPSSSASLDEELDLGITVDDELVDIDMLASTIMDSAFHVSATSSLSSLTESERALERDRRKIVRQRNRNNNNNTTTNSTSLMEQGLIDNFGQVASSRALEQIVDELIDQEVNNLINQNSFNERLIATNNHYYLTNEPFCYKNAVIKTDFDSDLLINSNNNGQIGSSILKNSGKTATLTNKTKRERKISTKKSTKVTTRKKVDKTTKLTQMTASIESLSTMNTNSILDKLSTMNTTCTAVTTSINNLNTLNNITTTSRTSTTSGLETFTATSKSSTTTLITSKSSATPSKSSIGRRRSRKQYWERRRRDQFGFLISSLQKKTYHCNCYDCQEKRKDDDKKPPIEVETIEVPQIWPLVEAERLRKPRGRGRPRKFPRIEDLIRHQQENNNNEGNKMGNNESNNEGNNNMGNNVANNEGNKMGNNESNNKGNKMGSNESNNIGNNESNNIGNNEGNKMGNNESNNESKNNKGNNHFNNEDLVATSNLVASGGSTLVTVSTSGPN